MSVGVGLGGNVNVTGATNCVPPSFDSQPVVTAPAGLLVGEDVVVSVSTSGTAVAISYQWQRDGVDIGGATGSSYTQTTSDIGPELTCVVTLTGACGAVSQSSTGVQWTGPADTFGSDLIWDYDAGTLSTVGTAVQTWTDLSGRGNDIAAVAPGNRPTLVAGATPNGYDAVQFDGTAQYLVNAGVSFGGALTDVVRFLVVRTDSYVSGRRYVDYRSGNWSASQSGVADQKTTTVVGVGTSTTTTAVTGSFEIWGFNLDADTRETWLNGVQEDLDGPSPLMNVLDSAALSVGGSNAGGVLCPMTLARCFAARRAATTQELTTVSAGLDYLYL